MSITHAKVSARADPSDATLIRPSDWNQAHVIADDTVTYAKLQNVSGTDKLLGRSTSGAGNVEEIACTAAGRALIDDSTAALQRTTLGIGGVISVKDHGAIGNGTTDDTAAIQAAINAASAGAMVYLPAATYRVTGTLTISNHRVHIVGAGKNATKMSFVPASGGLPLFHFSTGINAVLYQCSISKLSILGSGSLQKIGIHLTDTSEQVVQDVSMLSMTGNSSIGIKLSGREAMTLSRLSIVANLPMVISGNPNHSIDIDHLHAQDIYLLASGANPCVTIEDGVNLSNVTFDGYQPWHGGGFGLKWVDTTTAQASFNLTLKNVRWENATDLNGYIIDIEHNHRLQNLVMENIYGGLSTNGIKLRQIFWASISNYLYVDTAKTALDVDTTVLPLVIENTFFQAGALSSMGGLTTILDAGRDTIGGTTFPLAIYDVPTAAAATAFNRVALPGGLRLLGFTSSALPPTTTQLPTAKDCAIHKDTNLGTLTLSFNDGGAIKSVALV